jgi:hypothetical protein
MSTQGSAWSTRGRCPDTDTDGDGIVDRLDACPDVPQGPHGRNGCPLAYIKATRS